MSERDYYARWSYEQLIVRQPHVVFGGLWHKGSYYFVVCPSAETALTASGEKLGDWFHNKCRVAGSAISIVTEPPLDTARVAERNAIQAAVLAGSPRTAHDLLVEFCLLLPQDFPPFRLDNPKAEIVFVTESSLTPEEKSLVERACALVGESTPLRFAIGELAKTRTLRKRPHDEGLALSAGRLLDRSLIGRDLRFLVEEDDAFWGRQRGAVFTESSEPSAVLPPHWRPGASLRCVVSPLGMPDNIRTYLSLYSQVLLVAPLADHFDSFCEGLGATPNELAALIAKDRVRLLVPFSIERHPVNWLNQVAEQSPANVLLSRRLAAATVLDARERVPLLFPPLSMHERHLLLHALAANVDQLVAAPHRDALRQFIAELAETWSGAEQFVHVRGALGTSHLGIGFLADFLTRQFTGQDRKLELWAAAQKIEWAASLGAHTFSSAMTGYDESRACELLAALYSPQVPQNLVPSRNALKIVENLLAIDNDASVVSFADEISTASSNRLRDIVLRLSREKLDADFLDDAIAAFNADVRNYEKRPDRLKSFNLTGIFATSAALAAADPSALRLLPMAALLLGPLLNFAVEELSRRSESTGKFVDTINSLLAGQRNPDAVLVSRIKKDVARLK